MFRETDRCYGIDEPGKGGDLYRRVFQLALRRAVLKSGVLLGLPVLMGISGGYNPHTSVAPRRFPETKNVGTCFAGKGIWMVYTPHHSSATGGKQKQMLLSDSWCKTRFRRCPRRRPRRLERNNGCFAPGTIYNIRNE